MHINKFRLTERSLIENLAMTIILNMKVQYDPIIIAKSTFSEVFKNMKEQDMIRV